MCVFVYCSGDMGEVTIAGDHLHAAMKYTPIKGYVQQVEITYFKGDLSLLI